MSFLKSNPIVYAIEDEYEIFVLAENNGIIYVNVDGKNYYEDNSGCLSSEKNYAKIRIKQEILNSAKKYCVVYRKTIRRLAYFPEFEPQRTAEFEFKPLEKTEDIRIYHVADVHNNFDVALKTCTYFGDELDALIVNGDIGEVETVAHYEEVVKFVGDISKGRVPVVFARGNHDTRGRYAELFTEYFPCRGKKTYYTFSVGCLNGVVLDVGEDKVDDYKDDKYKEYGCSTPYAYNGVNIFHEYRLEQLDFLKKLKREKGGITFAISHIPPAKATDDAGTVFDIERDLYSQINGELERLSIKFMLSGHFHRTFILKTNDERSFMPHSYPIVVGSGIKIVGADTRTAEYVGTALVVNSDGVSIKFTNSSREVLDSEYLKF